MPIGHRGQYEAHDVEEVPAWHWLHEGGLLVGNIAYPAAHAQTCPTVVVADVSGALGIRNVEKLGQGVQDTVPPPYNGEAAEVHCRGRHWVA